MAKPLRLALGACIIQAEYGYSDEETALQIQENPYLQYFCGYPGYDDEKLPFDPSLMVYFRKRLTPEVLGEINEMIVRDAKERQVKEAESKDDDDDSDGQPGTGGNSGTMIVDATCAPSNIRYPQDVSLLNEARENAETLLDVLHDPADGKKPRTYRKRARKDYLKYTRCRKHTAKMTRKAIGKSWLTSGVTCMPSMENCPSEKICPLARQNVWARSAPSMSSRSTCTITVPTAYLTRSSA